MNHVQFKKERRRFVDTTPRAQFVPVTNNCKWVMRDGFAHAYCVAMGWELLMEEPDGMLFRAPADFDETGTRAAA